MRSHHLRQKLKRPPPLIHNIHKLLRRPDTPNNDLVFPTRQPFIRFVAELGQRHPQRAALLLAHVIVQLRLHGRRGDFEDFGS